MPFIDVNSNFADALTGERIYPGERVFDTGISNKSKPYQSNGKTRLLKEDTIVRLAEDAGFKVVRGGGDASVVADDDAIVEPTREVVGKDVGVGDGKAKAGKAKAGGRKSD